MRRISPRRYREADCACTLAKDISPSSISPSRISWRTCSSPDQDTLTYWESAPYSTLFTEVRGETVWKVSGSGQPPHHQPDHCSVDERFRASAKPLVVHRLIRRFCPSHENVRSTTHLR